ncbi:lysine N(6)-hydroxylase/L-ornithine N(5)-oxygenase family protein [Allokutzneria albata]|nr:SidA/IucD/PvdA family monooxygenase [Allokutzneria albata]
MMDVVGIGAGPANLSLAALLHPIGGLRARFLERRPELSWHPGLLVPGARMQVSFLKDLVTPVDPTNPYSFLSFLVEHGRLYRFLSAGFSRVSRAEFTQYLAWAAARLPAVEFGSEVGSVEHRDGRFVVSTNTGRVLARDLVVGTGPVPHIPDFARGRSGRTLFHSSDYLAHRPAPGLRVAVIGGGQSGAEVALDLLTSALPSHLLWTTRRSNFLPLDETPFTEEIYTPQYVRRFFGFPAETRQSLVDEHRLSSDGISSDLLDRLYHRLYELDFLAGANPARLLPGTTPVGLDRHGDGWRVTVREDRTGELTEFTADAVVLATGYTQRLPSCLDPIRDRLSVVDGQPVVGADFSLELRDAGRSRVFVQNGARHSHGLADPNLSLTAWRAATIVNSLLRKEVYRLDPEEGVLR